MEGRATDGSRYGVPSTAIEGVAVSGAWFQLPATRADLLVQTDFDAENCTSYLLRYRHHIRAHRRRIVICQRAGTWPPHAHLTPELEGRRMLTRPS